MPRTKIRIDGRKILCGTAQSEKIQDMQDLLREMHDEGFADFAILVFVLIIAHCDDYGRFSAKARTVKSKVFSTSNRPVLDFENIIKALFVCDLIELWGDDNEYLQIRNFQDKQGFQRGRRLYRHTDYPARDGDQEFYGETSEYKAGVPQDGVPYDKILSDLNRLTGRKGKAQFKATGYKNRGPIHERWKEGFRLEDFLHVNKVKSAQWKDGHMASYLRPETLYGPKMVGYMGDRLPVSGDDIKSAAVSAYSALKKLVASHGKSISWASNPPAGLDEVSSIFGGWAGFCNASTFQVDLKEKEFIDRYSRRDTNA